MPSNKIKFDPLADNRYGGWFTNLADGQSFGASDTTLIRPSLHWTIADNADMILRYEHGTTNGDGSASQNHATYRRGSFDFAVNRVGYADIKWDQAILEANFGVGFGDGKITNIFGWRDFENVGVSDIDGTTTPFFHSTFKTYQHQYSDELRYAGQFFERMDLTVGAYWFAQNMDFFEHRYLTFAPYSASNAANSAFGGSQYQYTYAAFSQADIDVTDTVTLNVGLRYSYEDKRAKVATFAATPATPTLPAQPAPPGPYDAESQSSFEVGAKMDWLDNRLRTNIAIFHNTIDGMQRDVNTPGAAGVVQVTANTADATVQGAELELQAILPAGFQFTGSLGYVDGKYDRILSDPRTGLPYDLNSDGQRNDLDRQLEIPRLAPLTYSVGISNETRIGNTVSSRVSYSHRDKNYYTDNNRGYFDPADMLDAGVALKLFEEKLTVSVFGTNLTNEATIGGNTLLPASIGTGATFSPLNKGRVVGLEMNFKL